MDCSAVMFGAHPVLDCLCHLRCSFLSLQHANSSTLTRSASVCSCVRHFSFRCRRSPTDLRSWFGESTCRARTNRTTRELVLPPRMDHTVDVYARRGERRQREDRAGGEPDRDRRKGSLIGTNRASAKWAPSGLTDRERVPLDICRHLSSIMRPRVHRTRRPGWRVPRRAIKCIIDYYRDGFAVRVTQCCGASGIHTSR